MKHDNWITDSEVEAEIEELINSPYVKLARKEAMLKNKRRQKLYQLRTLEKRGRHLEIEGINLENIEEFVLGKDEEVEE